MNSQMVMEIMSMMKGIRMATQVGIVSLPVGYEMAPS